MSEHLERRLKALAYHAPTPPVQALMAELRKSAQVFVCLIDKEIPECREKSLAFTAFEETMMWCMKGLSMTDTGAKQVSP